MANLRWVLVVILVAGACSGAEESSSISAAMASTESSAFNSAEPTATSSSTIVTVTTATTGSPTTTALPTTTTTLADLQGLALETVAEGLDQPVLVMPNPGTGRLLVVEREGLVREIGDGGAVATQPYLDLTGTVGSSGIEQGLLGMALHPGGARLFVYYTLPSDDSVLAEIALVEGRPQSDTLTELIRFEQPTSRHNAGMIQFGPDGYLYLSLGEGGAAGTHSQDPETLLSSILRLDVDGGTPYSIPSDNPFVGGGGAPEVWAFGLRNPWRFAIDASEGLMYIADVGHSEWEEVNVVPLDPVGYNFGWVTMEGSACFSGSCDPTGLVLPALEYPHPEGCSITGGFVYRGEAIPEIDGHYFYADWCTGFIRSFRYENGAATDLRDWTAELGFSGQVNSFGLDASGELLIATWEGIVYRIVPRR